MKTVFVPLPGNEKLAASLAQAYGGQTGAVSVRYFPDGETHLQYEGLVAGRRVVLVSTLDRPDDKFLPLIFAASTARDLGAIEVGLVAPYLSYMRQDKRFHAGEAVTAPHFARALGAWIDWLVTIDPHLHRIASLSEIYPIPTYTAHASSMIAAWVHQEVTRPVLIGPDSESAQWVSAVAKEAGVPFTVLEKIRHGDKDVEVSMPDIAQWHDHTPVLVDDIISTARTMIETVEHLQELKLKPPICIGVHAVFAGTAYQELKASGAAQVITCSTIEHESNGIDITAALVEGVQYLTDKVD